MEGSRQAGGTAAVAGTGEGGTEGGKGRRGADSAGTAVGSTGCEVGSPSSV